MQAKASSKPIIYNITKAWCSFVEGDEGLYLANYQTNLIIALHAPSLLFWHFINSFPLGQIRAFILRSPTQVLQSDYYKTQSQLCCDCKQSNKPFQSGGPRPNHNTMLPNGESKERVQTPSIGGESEMMAPSFALVVNGHSLVHALTPELERLFLGVAEHCTGEILSNWALEALLRRPSTFSMISEEQPFCQQQDGMEDQAPCHCKLS